MEWQAIVLVMQILMLAVGWFLFQQARGELSARAAETPVLGEVKALQRSIKQLLSDLEQASQTASERAERSSELLESRCAQARELLEDIDCRLEELANNRDGASNLHLAGLNAVVQEKSAFGAEAAVVLPRSASALPAQPSPVQTRDMRRESVFALADAGHASSAIARETGLSEGEIETLLGLRMQRT